MSDLFNHNDLRVEVYLGPDVPGGGDRRRYSIINDQTLRTIDLSSVQWATLGEFFTADCSMECEGPRLSNPIPDTWRWHL